jgi:cobalt/nickel transport system permease protein
MAGVHALIGIGEGLITAAAVGLVLATRADLLQLQKI